MFIFYAVSFTAEYHSFLSKPSPSRYFAASHFARFHVDPKAKIGTFQSGALSYWLDNQVVNLDGVINEEAYFHLKNKTMDVYLEQQQIDFLMEEVYLFRMWNHYLDNQLSKNYSMVSKKSGRGWYELGIYKRKP